MVAGRFELRGDVATPASWALAFPMVQHAARLDRRGQPRERLLLRAWSMRASIAWVIVSFFLIPAACGGGAAGPHGHEGSGGHTGAASGGADGDGGTGGTGTGGTGTAGAGMGGVGTGGAAGTGGGAGGATGGTGGSGADGVAGGRGGGGGLGGGGAGGAGGASTFSCGGGVVCTRGQSLCHSYIPGVPGAGSTTYSCPAIPASCATNPTCACVCPPSTSGLGCAYPGAGFAAYCSCSGSGGALTVSCGGI